MTKKNPSFIPRKAHISSFPNIFFHLILPVVSQTKEEDVSRLSSKGVNKVVSYFYVGYKSEKLRLRVLFAHVIYYNINVKYFVVKELLFLLSAAKAHAPKTLRFIFKLFAWCVSSSSANAGI